MGLTRGGSVGTQENVPALYVMPGESFNLGSRTGAVTRAVRKPLFEEEA